MSENLKLNDVISFAFVSESIYEKMITFRDKFLDEVIEQLSENEIKTLEKDYYLFFKGKLINQYNRILVSDFLHLILKKIRYEKNITPLEFQLVEKICGWSGLSIGQD